MMLLAEFAQRARIHFSDRATACAICAEPTASQLIDKYFTQDAARGIARAQNQNIDRHIQAAFAYRVAN